MKLAFVYPNIANVRSRDAMQPLVFAILAALTPADVEIRLLDERLEEVDYHYPADLVAITVQTFTAKRAYRLAQRFQKQGCKVVLGGIHPFCEPEEAAAYADSLILGDAEPVWPQVMEDARQNRLKPRYLGPASYPMEGIIPDRSLFQGRKYSSLVPVQFGRGCKNRCSFCSIPSRYGFRVRQRPVADLVTEISSIRSTTLFFVDDNLVSNYKQARELFQALRPLKKRWVCQVNLDVAFQEDLVKLMAASGCLAVFTGFESLDPACLKRINKGVNLRHPDYEQAINRFKEQGIMVAGSFMFGHDFDTKEAFGRAFAFSQKTKLSLCHFNPLFPTPGTPFYGELARSRRLLFDKWWLDPGYKYGMMQFDPLTLGAKTVSQQCYALRKRFNSLKSILYRALDFRANSRSLLSFFVYFLANWISRREIKKKQGLTLGAD